MALKECMNILLEDAKKQDALIEADITAYATMLSNIDIHSEKRKLYRDKYRTFVHQLMQISGRNTLNLSESGSIHVIELNKKQENEEDEIERNQQLIKEQKEYFKSITEKDYEKLWEMPDAKSALAAICFAFEDWEDSTLDLVEDLLRTRKIDFWDGTKYFLEKALIESDRKEEEHDEIEKLDRFLLEMLKRSSGARHTTMWKNLETVIYIRNAQRMQVKCNQTVQIYQGKKEQYELFEQNHKETQKTLSEQLKQLASQKANGGVKAAIKEAKTWYHTAIAQVDNEISKAKNQYNRVNEILHFLEYNQQTINKGLESGMTGEQCEKMENSLRELEMEADDLLDISELESKKEALVYGFKQQINRIKREKGEVEKKQKKAAEEKIRRRESLKQNRKSIIIITICLLFFAVAGVAFYFRFMTPTYYGGNYYLGGSMGYEEYIIDESVTTIHPKVFKGAKMKEITIPESVQVISGSAFQECEFLEKINLPSNLTEIGDNAFQGCSALTEITIPESVVWIGSHAFSDCTSLKRVTFENKVDNLGEHIFANCCRLDTLIMPNGGFKLNDSMFYNCCNLDLNSTELEQYGISEYNLELYTSAVEGIPLLENEVQLKNVLYGKQFYDETSDMSTTISRSGLFSNINLENETVNEQGRKVVFVCDYQEDVRLMHLIGTVSQNVGEAYMTAEVNCTETTVDSDLLLAQGEDGNYPMMQKLLAGKEFTIGESNVSALEEEIFVNKVRVKKREGGYKVQAEYEVRKLLGTLDVAVTMQTEGANFRDAQLQTDSVECSSLNLEGTYGDCEVRKYASKRYVMISKVEDYGFFFEMTRKQAVQEMDWSGNNLAVDGSLYTKHSNELTEITEEESKLNGVWSGSYMQQNNDTESAVTKYMVVLGNNRYIAVFDFGSLPGKRDMESGRILELAFCNGDNINFYGKEFIVQPKGYSFADFSGQVNKTGTEMWSDSGWVFKMNKVDELEDLSGVL